MKTNFLILVLAIAAVSASICDTRDFLKPVSVELLVFSGSSNPTWTLTELELTQFCKMRTTVNGRCDGVMMGYNGFIVGDEHIQLNMKLELFLLGTAAHREVIPRNVLDHCFERIQSGRANGCLPLVSANPPEGGCKGVVGPDTVPTYDPQDDDQGCFISDQPNNNCYNYGNDIASGTFAQPGRGTGQKWSENTCEDIRASAERDGLVWAGTDLPTDVPEDGHFVALLIWPRTNFHWIRMDKSKYWSHKPGGQSVRDVDANGKQITDPSKSDFSPWTQFCGYMTTIPSEVKIN